MLSMTTKFFYHVYASKILLNVLLKRMENKLEEEDSNTQAGFRKNRGTRDHIFNLRMIIQKYREINASLHTCFIDYSKAFDCVNHEQMWQTLKEMNFNFFQPETYKPHQITV